MWTGILVVRGLDDRGRTLPFSSRDFVVKQNSPEKFPKFNWWVRRPTESTQRKGRISLISRRKSVKPENYLIGSGILPFKRMDGFWVNRDCRDIFCGFHSQMSAGIRGSFSPDFFVDRYTLRATAILLYRETRKKRWKAFLENRRQQISVSHAVPTRITLLKEPFGKSNA